MFITAEGVKKYIKELKDLSSRAALLSKILTIDEDGRAPADELHKLIAHDPVLAQRVLRVANSGAFGHSGQITDIHQAVLFLGFDRIKSLAAGMTAVGIFPFKPSSHTEKLWIHGYEVGFIAAGLSRHMTSVHPVQSFMAGLLHDVGRIVFHGVNQEESWNIKTDSSMLEQEARAFGCTHEEAGAWFCEAMTLPREISGAVRCHHTPSGAKDMRPLVSAVALAEALSMKFNPRPESDGVWTEEHNSIIHEFSLKDEDMNAISLRLAAAGPEIQVFFS